MHIDRQLKVLIVDDDEDDFLIFRETLNEISPDKFDIQWSNNYDDSLEKIKSKLYNIYFIDFRLGKETGLALLNEAIKTGCEEPVIMLTGRGNKDIDIQAMTLGATDYLIKSELNAEKLERCIRYSLERTNYIKSLKESEKKYKHLFEGAKDAVFIADKSLKFIEINPAVSELLGQNINSISGNCLYDFIADVDQISFIKEHIRQQRNVEDVEIRLYNKNGELRYCQFSLSLETPGREQQFVYGIMHDITNLKIAANSKIQIEKFAANERLIRIIAHEIRNPLTNIHLSADHLKLNYTNGELEPYLGIIERNGIRINDLITELLNFSKPIELVSQKISIQEILDKCLLDTMDRLQLKEIELVKDYSDRPFEIIADKQKLAIAISNIIINAIEAMEERTGRLSLKIDDTKDHILLHIKDNGKGIPEEFLSRITEPFFTLKRKGMGIGLTAALSILKSHQAQVEIQSKIDVGTSFIIFFDKAESVIQKREAEPEPVKERNLI